MILEQLPWQRAYDSLIASTLRRREPRSRGAPLFAVGKNRCTMLRISRRAIATAPIRATKLWYLRKDQRARACG